MAKYKKLRPHDEIVIALIDLDFAWAKGDIQKAKELWNSGASIVEMAEILRPARQKPRRTTEDGQYEVLILLLHLLRKNKIEPRPGGILGDCVNG